MLAVVGVGFAVWTVVGVWLEFRSIERIEVNVDEARAAISLIPDDERPSPPPEDDDLPVETEPPAPSSATTTTFSSATESTAPTSSTTTTSTTTTPPTTSGPPDILGEQLPYDPAFSTSPPVPDEVFEAFLIIGSDLSGALADVIIFALLPEDDSPPMLVSIPRDLWLPNVCWNRPARANASLNGCGKAASGPELLAITIADFTGIQPDHFALFDFADFKRVIDAFGGVRICVNNPVREGEGGKGAFRLKAGCTKANGKTVLGWVRSRHTQELVGGSWRTMRGVTDLTRNKRQRDVLIELLKKVKSLDTLTSLVGIVGSLSDAVTIDDGIDITAAIDIAWGLRSVAPGDIVQITIPVSGYRTSGDASVLLPTKSFEEVLAEHWP